MPGELILPWVLAVERRLKLRAMAGLVVPYPTLSEVSKRAAGSYYAPRLFSCADPLAGAPAGQARMSAARGRGAGCRCWRSWCWPRGGLRLGPASRAQPRDAASASATHSRRSSRRIRSAPLAFVLVYAVATALSLPGRGLPDLAGGFLFGTWLGGALVGAWRHGRCRRRCSLSPAPPLGSTPARPRRPVAAPDGGGLPRATPSPTCWCCAWCRCSRSGSSTSCRPCWACRWRPSPLATFLGIIPGDASSSPASAAGWARCSTAARQPNLGLILEPQVLLPLLGLAALALLPVAYRRWQPAGRLSSGRRCAPSARAAGPCAGTCRAGCA